MAVSSVVRRSELEGALRLDAEYYRPEYLATLDALRALKSVPLEVVAEAARRRFRPKEGEPFSYVEISEVDTSTGTVNAVAVPGEEAPDRAQWLVRRGDVIVSTVRPIRNAVALITQAEDGFVCSSGFAVLRAVAVSPEFLYMYLKARPVAELLDRKTTATMYPAVSWQDVLSIPIFWPDRRVEEFVRGRVAEAQAQLKRSESLHLEAERLVLEELGWGSLDLSQSRWYSVPLSRAQRVGRLDAEHFQPKYERIFERIQRFPCLRLGDVTQAIQNGKTPAAEDYSMEGVPILKVGGLGSTGVIEECDAYVPPSWAQANTKGAVRQYDALVLCAAHHPSYIGKAGLLMRDLGPLARAVGELIILRFNDRLRPEFVCVFLNLEHVRLAVQGLARGNTAHLYPDDLSAVPVPLLPPEFQQRVADMVTQSYEAKQKAKALLQEAKGRVEALIETVEAGQG